MNNFECPRCGHCCQALETEQEPVGWLDAEMSQAYTVDELADASGTGFLPLYTAPPKREWVGLHGSEVPELYKYDVMFMEGWLWAEEKLKEKNHG